MKDEVHDFYNGCAEVGRLERRLGKIEFYRTTEILRQYIKETSVIYDVGGGIGMYAKWLAEQGHDVHLLELAENQVEYAKKNMMEKATFQAETADARKLPRTDNSADVVLLMGPLYHLQEREERMVALAEAYRVLKPGGLLIAAGISKYSSATWALSTYTDTNTLFEEDGYFNMLREEIETGCHNRPKGYEWVVAKAYFHTAEAMEQEIREGGFQVENSHAVEGCIWFTPNLMENWENPQAREKLLKILHMTELDKELMGMSPHFLTVAKKIS
ncbi:MAG: class I SAM-dependent methyltransferase [Firmicutes bacterium]|nr:class I SAM-dependent methyltransferase [Bacillota bacterium]